MSIDYAAVVENIKTTFETVDGIATVYDHEPGIVGGTPAVIFVMERTGRIEPASQELAIKSIFTGYLLNKDLNFRTSRAVLYPLIWQVFEAFGVNLMLGGTIGNGQVLVTTARDGVLTVGGNKYLAVPLTIEVISRTPFDYATGA